MKGFDLATIDMIVIGLYFGLVLFIGFRIAARTHSGDDLFLAGRRLGWFSIGCSLFASNISSTTLIGLAGAAYVWGIAVSNYEWMAAIILVFFSFFIIPVYLNARISTVPEYLELRFNRRARIYFSALTLFSNIVVDTAGSLFAGAMVLKVFFPDIYLLEATMGLAMLAGIYTAAGGLAAVVYTDVLQSMVLFIGACILTYLAFAKINFSWEAVTAAVPASHLSLGLPIDDPNLPWLGTLIGVPVLGFYFWCTNQFIVQRVLGARSIADARRGSLFAGLLKLTVLYIMVFPGVIAVAFLPDLEQGDMVFPALINLLLPAGVKGLVLAGLAAAIMSSIDSTLNSAASLLTMDFIRPKHPGMTPRRLALVGRVSIVGFMFLAALCAPLIGNFEGLFHYLQTALAFLVPPVAAVFIGGLFSTRAGEHVGIITLAGGHALSLLLFLMYTTDILKLHFTIIAGVIFAVSLLIFLAASSLQPRADPVRIGPLVSGMHSTHEGHDARKGPDYRFYSVILLIVTAMIVAGAW